MTQRQAQQVEKTKEKALKQPKTKSGKRKKCEKHVNFSSSHNEVDQKEVPPDDSFVCVLYRTIVLKDLLFLTSLFYCNLSLSLNTYVLLCRYGTVKQITS
jgi:hypothetical protein